ncbi:MAG TPA: hypothetical protein VG028_13425 [Terriglobia bacterium]|nr:hypothetical protein [Terriglobia bacterium]
MSRLLSVWLVLVLCAGCAETRRKATTTREIHFYQGRPDGLVAIETWRDIEKGGGWFLMTDPTVQSISATHTNQAALGGGSLFQAGPMDVKVDPQTGAIISAGGTAVGNVIGAAMKSAVK